MTIHCPNCKEALELPESAVGAKVSCPFCGEKFIGEEEVLVLKPAVAEPAVRETPVEDGVVPSAAPAAADAVEEIEARTFAAIQEAFRLYGKVEPCLKSVSHGTVFTTYSLSGDMSRLNKVFFSPSKTRDVCEQIGFRLGKVGVTCWCDDILVPAEDCERPSFWRIVSELETKVEPFWTDDEQGRVAFWKSCEAKGQASMSDMAHVLPYVSAMGAVTSAALFCGGIQMILGDYGSGKTTCLNAAICTLALFRQPSAVKVVVLDPRGEMPDYSALPHAFAGGTVVGYEECKAALRTLAGEIDRRHATLAETCSNLRASYNAGRLANGLGAMPVVAVFIDNLDALVRPGEKEVHELLGRLSQAWHEGFYTIATAKDYTRATFKTPRNCNEFCSDKMFALKVGNPKMFNMRSASEFSEARQQSQPGVITSPSCGARMGREATLVRAADVADVIAIARSADKESAYRERVKRG